MRKYWQTGSVFTILMLCLAFYSAAHCQDTVLAINHTELFVKDTGKGSPIIIIHGGPGLSQSYLQPHLNDLAKQFRLIYYDQRASGRSSGRLDSTQVNMRLFVEDIEAIRKSLQLGNICILAHSWGSLLAIQYATQYPEHTNGLILSNPISLKSGEFDAETSQELKKRTTSKDSVARAAILQSDAFKKGDLAAYTQLLQLSFKPSFAEKKNIKKLNLQLPPDYLAKRKILFYMSKDLTNYYYYGMLPLITCPVLVIHGAADAIPLAVSEKIRNGLLHARLEIIKKAGHFPFIEKRKEYAGIVDVFLQAIQKNTKLL